MLDGQKDKSHFDIENFEKKRKHLFILSKDAVYLKCFCIIFSNVIFTSMCDSKLNLRGHSMNQFQGVPDSFRHFNSFFLL